MTSTCGNGDPVSEDDGDLVRRAKTDRAVFGVLFDRYYRRVARAPVASPADPFFASLSVTRRRELGDYKGVKQPSSQARRSSVDERFLRDHRRALHSRVAHRLSTARSPR